jgi:hypothetical protein
MKLAGTEKFVLQPTRLYLEYWFELPSVGGVAFDVHSGTFDIRHYVPELNSYTVYWRVE